MEMAIPESRLNALMEPLGRCRICPRSCGSERIAGITGICGNDARFNISSICIHRGEEPVISGPKGICNIFFSGCNLSCVYCQNYQISSSHGTNRGDAIQLDEVISKIIPLLDQGSRSVGFVSPSHCIPHVKAIIEALREKGYHPVFVYNTNGYDKVEEIRGLEGYIDVYLPDYKYADDVLSNACSNVHDYRKVAFAAIKEMYRQKGSTLIIGDEGFAERGLIIRHLVLPGNIENSLAVLRDIAKISECISISLMAQYWPTPAVKNHPLLGRTLTPEEYATVLEELENLGFYQGWTQEIDSNHDYRPHFEMDKPFWSEKTDN